jgi:poly(hydroxyalkanoate) depolymerase family esterase
MHWSDGIRTLRRGVGVASRLAVARIVRPPPAVTRDPGRFVVAPEFGANPGRLRLRVYRPAAELRAGVPLIVLLHGCGQDAAVFAADAGWTALADRLGLPLLLPEQQADNNRQRCFHWFQPADTTRGQGEAGSIAAMVRAATARFDADPARVFIAGLSAGAAMAVAMLAAYPELFAAGAAVAGLPVGAAGGPVQALARMAGAGPAVPAEALAERVRAAAPASYAGPWPRLSVWCGTADNVVAPENSLLLAAQWRALHRLPEQPTLEEPGHRAWGNAVELWSLPNLPHAWPVATGTGQPAHFTADSAVAAVPMIARFWDLA